MDFDEDVESDPEPQGDDRNLLDDEDEDEDDGSWRRERSLTPVYNDSDAKSKPRKRLIKKSTAADEIAPDFGIGDEDDGHDVEGIGRGDSDNDGPSSSGGGKRKKVWKDGSGSSRKREKKSKSDRRERHGSDKGGSKFMAKKSGYSGGTSRDRNGDAEVKEMWDTIAGGDSEDDQEGNRTLDDDNFIDDTGVDPTDRYGSDYGPRSPGDAPQAEEGEDDDEINQLFKMGKKKKKGEQSAADIALLVENVMAELEVVAEEDADLNRQSKPAINKLKKLPLLTEVLSKKQLQQEFLDHGVLTLLKNWLEPLPDGSLPNINIRSAILKILTDLPIDLEQFDRREQLKKSGLGKVRVQLIRQWSRISNACGLTVKEQT
ncbi:transcription elongation factor (TFIIS) family protein [Actinidia rufa]|uniref:Transcription elongation factor (TFIIS) family protein n=1 Tax=Actinidia rufa TaxID=165716 RepID=A0A7J0GDE3_9ERIC|nr:transcription elongation factor (TFIIS) family protein [Actinidia rufa]